MMPMQALSVMLPLRSYETCGPSDPASSVYKSCTSFNVNVTRKIARPLSKPSARAVVDAYTPWCVNTTPAESAAAFRIEDEAGISFWDALIVAAASKTGRGGREEGSVLGGLGRLLDGDNS